MGWFRVDHVAARVRRMGTLSAALIKNGGKKGGVSLRVRLSRDVQQVAGLTAGDTIDLDWGDGELAGRVLLTKAEGDAGTGRLRWQHPDAKAAVETRFGALPDGHFPGADGRPTCLAPTTRPAAACPWTVAGGAIEVTLPAAWFSAPPEGARPVSRLAQAAGLALECAEVEEAAAAVGVQTWHSPQATIPTSPPFEARPFPPDFAKLPERPVEKDKVERCIELLGKGLYDSEIIKKLRCTPQFLNDCKLERSVRRTEANGAAVR
jgi:hypothetical protein